MKKQLEIQPPIMPDTFSYKNPTELPKGVSMQKYPNIPIELLKESEAIEFGEMMRDEFIKHWKMKVRAKPV